ncbi:hypothetical protein DFS34DRAFT_613154, partial [Phlyctochytrium arcticum]
MGSVHLGALGTWPDWVAAIAIIILVLMVVSFSGLWYRNRVGDRGRRNSAMSGNSSNGGPSLAHLIAQTQQKMGLGRERSPQREKEFGERMQHDTIEIREECNDIAAPSKPNSTREILRAQSRQRPSTRTPKHRLDAEYKEDATSDMYKRREHARRDSVHSHSSTLRKSDPDDTSSSTEDGNENDQNPYHKNAAPAKYRDLGSGFADMKRFSLIPQSSVIRVEESMTLEMGDGDTLTVGMDKEFGVDLSSRSGSSDHKRSMSVHRKKSTVKSVSRAGTVKRQRTTTRKPTQTGPSSSDTQSSSPSGHNEGQNTSSGSLVASRSVSVKYPRERLVQRNQSVSVGALHRSRRDQGQESNADPDGPSEPEPRRDHLHRSHSSNCHVQEQTLRRSKSEMTMAGLAQKHSRHHQYRRTESSASLNRQNKSMQQRHRAHATTRRMVDDMEDTPSSEDRNDEGLTFKRERSARNPRGTRQGTPPQLGQHNGSRQDVTTIAVVDGTPSASTPQEVSTTNSAMPSFDPSAPASSTKPPRWIPSPSVRPATPQRTQSNVDLRASRSQPPAIVRSGSVRELPQKAIKGNNASDQSLSALDARHKHEDDVPLAMLQRSL